MAATGLLGINPYKKGVAIDISSKPTQMLIQLQQKEQAKNEALDKYFMDYDKNITPAGMRNIDIEGLMKRKNEAKQYYFQNKAAIRRPELDNGKAYSQFMGMNTDQLGYVTKSKEQTGKAKALSTATMNANQKRQIIADGVKDALVLNELALDDPRRVDFDIANFRTYDPYDDKKFMENVWGKAELPTKIVNKDIGKGMVIPETYHLGISEMAAKAPERLRDAEIGTRAFVRNNEGAVKYFKTLMEDPKMLAEANKVYKEYKGPDAKIIDEEDFAVGYGLIQKPGGFIKAGQAEETKAFTRSAQDALARSRADLKAQNRPKMKNLFDMTGSGGVPVKLGSTGYEIVAGKVLDKEGKPATINLKDVSGSNFQPEFYSALENYGIDLRSRDKYKLVAKDGIIQSITSPKNKVITRTTIMNAQKKFDTERKGESPLYSYEEEVEDVVTPGGVDLNKFLKK